MKKIKVKDKEIILLSAKILGYREVTEALIEILKVLDKKFWEAIFKKYPEIKNEKWKYDHIKNELIEYGGEGNVK